MTDRKLTNAEATKIRQEVARQVKAEQRSKARKVVTTGAKSQWQGFADFMRTQGVVALAIGLVLGVQIKALVDQIIASFIEPILGVVLPGEGDLDKKIFVLSVFGEKAEFEYGAFISVFISFITVALLVYFGVKALRLDKMTKKD
ncbi:MscL family protein [Candidatus Parcubacteria bacterium]|nr:MscL family protein [Candidatus Parcubacteria bacterium]